MNIKVEQAGPCQKTILVEIPAAVAGQLNEQVAREFSTQASMPGFRPGRAPLELVRKRYAKDIEAEAKERMIHEGLREALRQHPLRMVSELQVEKFEVLAGAPVVFKGYVEVAPEFDLPEYKGLPLTRHKQEVKDEAVTEMLNLLRDRAAQWKDVADRPVRRGDLVRVDYEGIADGKAITELAPKAGLFGKAEGFSMLADDQTFLPGLGRSLVDMKTGEKKQIPVDFPADFFDKTLAGKKAMYFVTVKGIQEKHLPPMDAEFFKTFQVSDEAGLRDRIRQDLAASQEQQERSRLRQALIEELLKRVSFEIPPSEAARETERVVYDTVSELRARGVDKDEIEKHKGKLLDSAARRATGRVKLRYLLDRIADAEKIESSEEELQQRIAFMAQHYRMAPADMRAELEKNEAVDGVKMDVVADKTLDWLLGQAHITETAAPAPAGEKTS